MPSKDEFQFVPADKSHIALLSEWFAKPHVKQWWPDGSDVLEELARGWSDPHCTPYIAIHNDAPIAYVQSWSPSDNEDYPWQKGFEATLRGIDLFIGAEQNLNRGNGTKLIKSFVRKLVSDGASRIVIDPDPENTRAIRAYEKAGFRAIRQVQDVDGTSLLMELKA